MGNTVGFICPVCDLDEAEIRGYERNEDGHQVGILLTCKRCGWEWREGV